MNSSDEDLEANNTTNNSEGSEGSSEHDLKLIENIQVKDLNLKIHKGEFICVIGEVGSGKSSLISAILGDMIYLDQNMIDQYSEDLMNTELRRKINQESMDAHKGLIKVGGSISYVQQIPWIQNKTIRDNILFGLNLDEDRYNRTIEICQLASDLEMLPGGDLTEIGEKGINLSGGQKARISLARAVYANKDIILMDDPISALDSNVKKKIFDQVFMKEMKYKTRVLVTHAVDFIDKADKIIIMENGKIKSMGTYQQLRDNDEVKDIIKKLSKSTFEDEKEEEKSTDEDENLDDKSLKRSFMSEDGTNITEDENNEIIDVKWSIYRHFFFKDYNWITYIIIIPSMFVFSYFVAQNTIVTGKWIENSENDDKFWYYFKLVIIYPIAYSFIISLVFLLINYATLRISRTLHKEMLQKVCKAPINLYFDKTPSGRILNRFSSDIGKIDDSVGQ